MEQLQDMLASESDALARMTEATLTTIELLARRDRVPRTELARQLAIAQTGVDALRGSMTAEDRLGFPRLAQVIESDGDVAAWLGKV
jgi:phage gp36-like protein